MKSEFPEIKNFTRVRSSGKRVLNYGDKKIQLDEVIWATLHFCRSSILSWLAGDRLTALQAQ